MSTYRSTKTKRVFIGFAIEDEWARNLLRGQKALPSSPIDFTDMSVKEPWSSEWKTKCRVRIKGCDGMIAFLSSNTRTADGALWEIQCAIEEGIPIIGIWTTDDQTFIPPGLPKSRVKRWTWANITSFLDSLS